MNICCYAGVTSDSHQIVASVLPQVNIMAWRTEWRAVEPKPPIGGTHNYKWTNLDAAVAAAAAVGKQSTIRVMGGSYTPSWVQPQVTYLNANGSQQTNPILWDSSYLTPYCQMIAALCQRYGTDPRVAWIIMSGCGLDDEMVISWSTPLNVWQSPADPPDGCGHATYTPQAFINGWNQCIDAYRANLPKKMRSALCFDLVGEWPPPHNPMFVGNETEAIIAHCQTYGKKVWLQNNGLHSKHNTTTTGKTYESKVYTVIVTNAATTTVGWQMQRDQTSATDMQACMDIAAGSGASYVEVWPVDSANSDLAPAYGPAPAELK